MRITLVNWSTKEEIIFHCLSWNIDNYQHVFYQDEENKIVEKCFNTRYWDIRDIEWN